MKYFGVFLCVFLAINSFAQTTFSTMADSVWNVRKIEAFGNLDLNGTSLQRDLYQTLIFGGEIDQTTKDNSMKAHGSNNRFGIFGTAELVYSDGIKTLDKNKRIGWHVKAGYYVAGNINYTKDAYRMAFYGNEYFQNDTATFTGTRVRMTQFQKIGFGIDLLDKRFSATINFVNVQNDVNLYIQKGKWIDINNSSVVQVDAVADAYYTSQRFSNGIGFAFDAKYQFYVPWGKSKAAFEVTLQNMGAAYINQGQNHYKVDSTYTYGGFNLDQLVGNSLFNEDNALMDSLRLEKDTVKRWIMLPGFIQAGKLIDYRSAKKLQTFFGIRFYPSIGVVPSGYVGLYYRFVPRWSAAANVAFGGSSVVRGGISIGYHSDKWRVQLATDDIYGALSRKGYGSSIVGRITWLLPSKTN
jgi:hypothetical protein